MNLVVNTKKGKTSLPRFSFLENFVPLLMALLPIIQPIKTFLPITWSMTAIIVSLPFIILNLNFRKIRVGLPQILLFVFCAYRVINHGTTVGELGVSVFFVLFAILCADGQFDDDYFFRTTVNVSCVAAVILLLQYLVHITTGRHLIAFPPSLLRKGLENYEALIRTGVSFGMYRPSAFFLEPSAFGQYAIPALCFLLFSDEIDSKNRSLAALFSVGVVLSTSGIGIAMAVGIWGLYIWKTSVSNRKVKIIRLICIVLAAAVGLAFAIRLPVIQNSIARIFTAIGGESYSALQGRLGGGSYYLSQMSRDELAFGSGDTIQEQLTMYASSFYIIILSEGIVGIALFFIMLLSLFFKTEGKYRLVTFCMIILTFFTGIYNPQILAFYFAAVLPGLYRKSSVS